LTEEMTDSNRVLAAVTAAQSNFIASRPAEELFEDVLISFLDLTDSTSGAFWEGATLVASYGESVEAQATLVLRSGGEVFGEVRLAGRPNGYPEALLEDIEPLTRSTANLLRAHRSERERIRAEEALAEALSLAEEANRAKGAMLSRMSHELRTPLNAIIGFSQLLELEDISEEAQEQVSYVLDAGQHLLEIVDDVLGITDLESKELDLAELDLERAVSAARSRSRAPGRVCVSGAGAGRASAQLLGRVLDELLDNALRFSDGDVDVEVSPASIVVRDHGAGMPLGALDSLGSAFATTRASGSDAPGLGLALVVAAMSAMKGQLEVLSAPGEGTSAQVRTAR
jgi:signal transduction histidine kinase